MELSVGMYVRTKDGCIEKICAIENEHIYTDEDYLAWYASSNAFSKASYNLIDLIEVGDYVNGFPVIHKENDILKCGLLVQFKENEIKSIVTKEQFSSMEYKVNE